MATTLQCRRLPPMTIELFLLRYGPATVAFAMSSLRARLDLRAKIIAVSIHIGPGLPAKSPRHDQGSG
jgi:hypothetical protein